MQCGRRYCARHGGGQAGYGERCCECYGRVLEGFMIASSRAGLLADALQRLDHPGPEAAPAESLYYQALARAESGDLDASAGYLERLLSEYPHFAGGLENARRAASKVLAARSVRRLQADDPLGATEDLRRSATLADDGADQRALLASLVHQSALAYFRAGRVGEALAAWEAAQARDPQDVQVAHAIAVGCYRLASELEQSDPVQADVHWRKAIAHWAVVLQDQEYWRYWGQSRASAVGPVEDQTLAEVRQDLMARLRAEFRDHRTRYLEAKQPTSAARHAALEVDLARELSAAEEVRAALARAPKGGSDTGSKKSQGVSSLRVAVGPLMLAHWRAVPGGAALADQVEALAKDRPVLRSYLSPLGPAYTMIKDMKRYEDACADLRPRVKKGGDAAARELLVDALVASGRELLDANVLDRAVSVLEEAAGLDAKRGGALSLLVSAATKHARALADNDDTVGTAITMLERIRGAHKVSDPEFIAQLAQAYFRQGLVHNKREQHEASLSDLRKAIAIDPGNEAAKQNLVAAIMNVVGLRNKAEKYDEALALINEALSINPAQVDREMVGVVLANHAIKNANQAIMVYNIFRDRYAARAALQQAISELETAQAAFPGSQHIRQQLAVIRNQLNQL